MIRFYLVPALAVGDRRGPKYFNWFTAPTPLLLNPWEARDYGNEPAMLLASDLSDADDATLTSQSDVTKFADNLDAALGANLATMQAALAALNIPGQMLTATSTYRETVRGIMGVFGVAQCMQGKGYNIFSPGITLSSTMASLPAAARTALSACGTALGYVISSVTGTSTVRDLLSLMMVQASPSPMLGVTV
ncbi:MAG: hypothetical protein H0X39_13040 [Actinobacteria bacterium]|nr:hypothetical protein [Actinomycetota bacterium]